MNEIQQLCDEAPGTSKVLQGNIAFAVGCVRAGIHAADGYPGTPSTEVIDKGLSQAQDRITVGWSVNEAVAVSVGVGHAMAGRDCVVTMKIPGLYQACDAFTSVSCYMQPKGALIYYIASDFTPSSTQHVIDPRYLFKSCFVPVFEPRTHQEMHEAAGLAADISRTHRTPVVILAGGLLCHSEGLVKLAEQHTRPLAEVGPLALQHALPGMARISYDTVMAERMPGLVRMVEESPLNIHYKGAGRRGVITCGATTLLMREYKERFDPDLDILSVAFTNPLPMERIRAFRESIKGEVSVIEDGYRFMQEACLAAGLDVSGKDSLSHLTEWTPERIAAFLGREIKAGTPAPSVPRPPMICAGCPYRLAALHLGKLRKRGDIEAIFGDIGCNTLIKGLNALDVNLCMGASEAMRMGYVLSKPEAAARCVSIIGDGTECHSGMDATRNTVFRQVPGLKIVLDNEWIAMTGGQPSPSSPCNLAGQTNVFRLDEALKSQGAHVIAADAYDKAEIEARVEEGLKLAAEGRFAILIIRGTCIRKVPASAYGQKLAVDKELCRKCGRCHICPGIEASEDGTPRRNNLCSGCVSRTPACLQMCPFKALSVAGSNTEATGETVTLPHAPEAIGVPPADSFRRPPRLSLAIRGVGGQGNLFFGKVLAQMAFLAGYDDRNILKGETHGMAQMGGPVISTFGCGEVFSPALVPGTANVLIAMEKAEVLRPGFLDLLEPGGTVLMADTRILPHGLKPEAYPSDEAIAAQLEGYRVVSVDVLSIALGLGDPKGRCANVVMLGVLSTLPPFYVVPEAVWLQALKGISRKPSLWDINHAAFMAGRGMQKD